jgi:hypothetical protein
MLRSPKASHATRQKEIDDMPTPHSSTLSRPAKRRGEIVYLVDRKCSAAERSAFAYLRTSPRRCSRILFRLSRIWKNASLGLA